jgi:cytochrome d ubiquinol oxidase subunit I
VTGILYTEDALGVITGGEVGASVTAYVLTYTVLLISYVVVLTHIAGKGSE